MELSGARVLKNAGRSQAPSRLEACDDCVRLARGQLATSISEKEAVDVPQQ